MRLVLEQVATLEEVETHFSIDDIADLNEMLDMWHAAKAKAQKG